MLHKPKQSLYSCYLFRKWHFHDRYIKKGHNQNTHVAVLQCERGGTIQCEHGLRAALLQSSQPVAYAFRAFYDTETRYAQIEGLLAIVLAYEHFDYYIYRRQTVNVETA